MEVVLVAPQISAQEASQRRIGVEKRSGGAVQIVPDRPVARVVEHKCQPSSQDPPEISAEGTSPA